MSADDVKAMLVAALPDVDFEVEGAGAKFSVRAVGDLFAGKRPVQRQQLIYGVLNDKIATGEIHAVTMALYTPDEWSAAEK
ncbi:cell division protein BolA [Saccharospirillum sp. MSK14-1]|uniref:BolA family protein n=1 Tax=Saccharospirillum sp. MSK14-1 TaxID=1897632 RepID=UPI000D3B1E66|nr:BolA/IbaG family iron-sulfur metabolism protein [Saccharospirillum sp. MSK14-1]PTY38875.1 cell division protein BolA [Saccharospirillum sp. MSK14-1]